MRRKAVILSVLIIISVVLWYLSLISANAYFQKAFHTAIALTASYLVFKFILEGVVSRRITESRTRYALRKVTAILYILTFIAIAVAIWVENPQALLVSYGVLAAGAAVALQDLFKNIAGGVVIFLTGIYRVGDRVEINSKSGDVMDIGILYTTLMEMKEWVAGDLPTGRLTTIPNGSVLSGTVNNYTKDHPFIWDEITIPITYDSDWKDALSRITATTKKEVAALTKQAEKSISSLGEKYYTAKWAVEPAVFLRLTDNWIEFSIRYITDVRRRREIHASLSRALLEEIEKSENITVASESFNIEVTGFPEVKTRREDEA